MTLAVASGASRTKAPLFALTIAHTGVGSGVRVTVGVFEGTSVLVGVNVVVGVAASVGDSVKVGGIGVVVALGSGFSVVATMGIVGVLNMVWLYKKSKPKKFRLIVNAPTNTAIIKTSAPKI